MQAVAGAVGKLLDACSWRRMPTSHCNASAASQYQSPTNATQNKRHLALHAPQCTPTLPTNASPSLHQPTCSTVCPVMNAKAYSPSRRGCRMITHSRKLLAASLSGDTAALTCGRGRASEAAAFSGPADAVPTKAGILHMCWLPSGQVLTVLSTSGPSGWLPTASRAPFSARVSPAWLPSKCAAPAARA